MLPLGDLSHLACRLAAQFAREREHETIDAVAGHALEAARIATEVRTRGPTAAKLRKLEAVVAPYGASVVDNRDPDGMMLGLRFRGGRFSSGIRDILFLV